jgi:hypothetical protein
MRLHQVRCLFGHHAFQLSFVLLKLVVQGKPATRN